MRYFLASAVAVLSGCASVAQVGANVADDARDSSEFMLCRGITVGSWMRGYGESPERAAAWRTLCSNQVKQSPGK